VFLTIFTVIFRLPYLCSRVCGSVNAIYVATESLISLLELQEIQNSKFLKAIHFDCNELLYWLLGSIGLKNLIYRISGYLSGVA
jgi:hypothetical protein